MNNKSQSKLLPVFFGILILLFISVSFFVIAESVNPENTRKIGYEFLDNNSVVHIWNNATISDYYFDKDSGIQLTNHYEDYWTKNIFCIGYYNNDEWNKIACADELTNFQKSIETDNETYVNATLWKDITYGDYDMRLGVQYHLGLNDENLSIIIYGKNIGIDIPFELGFVWKVQNVNIPESSNGKSQPYGDSIKINNTRYKLNDTFGLLFKNMSHTYYDDELNETITKYDSYLRIQDWTEFLRIDWNKDLNYAVKMVGNGNQEDFYVAILINAGNFSSGQEKSTTFQWIDAEGDYISDWDTNTDGNTNPHGIATDGTNIWTTDRAGTQVYKWTMDGTYISDWDTNADGNTNPHGIATDGTNIWTTDDSADRVYKWTMDGTYISDFAGTNYPPGMDTNGTNIWIIDDNFAAAQVYKWTMDGTYISDWDTEGDGCTSPKGIATDGTNIWVTSNSNAQVYKWTMDGTYISDWDTNADGNTNIYGITTDGTNIWTVDLIGTQVYKWEGISAGDSTPPTFTDIPANTTINYTQGFGVDFDATDETEFDSYAINWTTLFEINSTGYLKNSTANIAVGTYLINVTINDTSGNENSTIYKVTINKATTNLGITGTTPITYGTTTNVAGTDCPSQLSCSLDKANAVYGVGTETFNYSTTGNENYTSDYITKGIVINKATLSGSLTNTDTWTEPYLESVTIGLSESNTGDGDVTYIVYRDGVSKTTGETITLGVGTYDYVLNSTGGTNYSTISNMDSQTLTVTQIASQTSLTFDVNSPQTYGTAITPTCSVTSGEGSAVLRQDGTIITSGVAITLGADTYSFNCSYAETTNYTSSENVSSYTINKATLSASITNDTSLTKTYDGVVTTIGISESNSGDGDVTYKLYVDGIDKGSSYTQATAGTYNIVLNSTGGTNYSTSANLDSETLTINQATTSCQVLFNETSPITYPNTFLVWSDCDSDFTLKRNGTVISNNSVQSLGVETYNFSVHRTDTVNYSTVYDDEYFTVNKATPSTDITWTSPITYGTASDALGVETNNGDGDVVYNLYREDSPSSGVFISVSNPDNTVLGVGEWNYKFEALEGTNYSQLNLTKGVLIVNQVSSSVNLTLNEIQGNTSINEDTSINLNCSTISGDSEAYLILYNNGTLINNDTSPIGNTTLFSEPGDYNITCVYENTQNYTASTTTFWLEVNDTTAPAVSTYYQWNSTNGTVDFGVWTEGFVSVNWNLTDSSGINTSTCQIKVRNKDIATNYTNLSYIDDLIHPDYDSDGYKNLTCYTENLGGVTRISANMTRSYDWRPLITALDQDSATHDNAYYSHGDKSTKIIFHNISNTINTTFIFLADVVNQTNTVADLIFYSCNSSYTSGDFTTSPYCALVGTASPTATRDVNFGYLIGALTTDENGMFGGVVHTETMYGISYCPSCTNTGNSWITYSTNGYDGHSETSANQGSHWTALSGEEFNVILHVIDNTQLEFNLTVEDNVGNELSVLQTDTYGALENRVPFGDIQTDNITGSLVSYYDIHGVTESGTIWINVTVSDPNADDVNCSIYLLNNNSSANQTLLANYSISGYGICSYEWNTTTIPDGDYRLNVTAFDGSLTGYDESSGYIRVDNTNPTWSSNETNLTSSTSINDSVYFNITLNDINPYSYIFSWHNGTVWENTTNTYTNGEEVSILKQISNNTVTINWTWYINDTSNNLNQTDVWSIDLSGDAIDPIVTKLAPISSLVTTTFTQTYLYNVSDNNNITSCSLLMDGSIVVNDTSINKSINNSFTYTQSVGTYIWSIECDDEYSNTGSSGNFSIQFYVEYGGGGGSSYSYYSQCYKVVNNECKYRAVYDAPCPDDYFTSLDLCESSLEIEEVEPTVAEKIIEAVKEIIDLDKVEDIEKKDTFLIVMLALSFGGILWYSISWYNNPKRKKVKLLYR